MTPGQGRVQITRASPDRPAGTRTAGMLDRRVWRCGVQIATGVTVCGLSDSLQTSAAQPARDQEAVMRTPPPVVRTPPPELSR
ncbi:hypothetical protein QR97_14905 [Streptomyces sp. PBH53]|nr:hypothetical protein QR97_14905 [Streptomyces sp. PBH53]